MHQWHIIGIDKFAIAYFKYIITMSDRLTMETIV